MQTAVRNTISADEQLQLPVQIGGGRGYLFVKRLFDIIMSVLCGAVLLVPMLIIAVIVRIDSHGPAIFRQQRMGKNGKIFTLYKFRTMDISAPSELAAREFHDSDQYVTKVGQFLRRTSIDELPQLWNIFLGDMSFVGYRPVCLTEERLNQRRAEYGVFAMRPGITGLAQVCGRDNLDYATKAELDAKYVSECSVKLDLWCLFRTVATVVSGEGVN